MNLCNSRLDKSKLIEAGLNMVFVQVMRAEIGITWPDVLGEYKGSASVGGYHMSDGAVLNLSDKDQKWSGLKETFKF